MGTNSVADKFASLIAHVYIQPRLASIKVSDIKTGCCYFYSPYFKAITLQRRISTDFKSSTPVWEGAEHWCSCRYKNDIKINCRHFVCSERKIWCQFGALCGARRNVNGRKCCPFWRDYVIESSYCCRKERKSWEHRRHPSRKGWHHQAVQTGLESGITHWEPIWPAGRVSCQAWMIDHTSISGPLLCRLFLIF